VTRCVAENLPEKPDQQNDSLSATTRRYMAKIFQFEEHRNNAEEPVRYLITKLEDLRNNDVARDCQDRTKHAQRDFSNVRRRD